MLTDTPLALPAWLDTHPRNWQPGTLDRDGLHTAALALTKHPQFDQARVEFITQFLHSFDGHAVMRRLNRSISLYFLVIFSFYLHQSKKADVPGSGMTLTALQELFAQGAAGTGGKVVFASPTKVKDMLAHARLQGLFRSVPHGTDKRIRLLEPTDMLTNAFADWILGYLRGSAVLLAPPVSLLPHSLSPALTHTLFSYRVRAYMQDGFTTTERFGTVRQFMMRDHGYSAFLRLMQTVRLEGGQYIATAPTSELASYRGIARATVRNTLAEAQAAGHLQTERGGNRVVLGKAFYDMAQHWFAVEMLWMHSLMSIAAVDQTL